MTGSYPTDPVRSTSIHGKPASLRWRALKDPPTHEYRHVARRHVLQGVPPSRSEVLNQPRRLIRGDIFGRG